MEVGDIYFPFVCLLHYMFCLTFIFANCIVASFAGYLVLSEGVMCCCIGRGGLLDAWMVWTAAGMA